jgi:hypothetical protein
MGDLPLSSTAEMENRFNGEIFSITLSLQPHVDITLELK